MDLNQDVIEHADSRAEEDCDKQGNSSPRKSPLCYGTAGQELHKSQGSGTWQARE